MRLWVNIGLLALGCGGLFCENPFFPPTGTPTRDTSFRRTPEGVIRQLETAYEHQRIDLFTDLFYPDSFRFYIALNYDPANITQIDSALTGASGRFPYIHRYYRGREFEYWGIKSELKSHESLFARATRLDFPTGLNVHSTTYLLDTIRGPDSGLVRIDTTRAEVVVEEGAVLNVESPRFSVAVSIGVQVFYLIRDPDDPSLWVIYKWFDLATR
jgi:hypothetical protein